VSNAINGRGRIGEEMRQRILDNLRWAVLVEDDNALRGLKLEFANGCEQAAKRQAIEWARRNLGRRAFLLEVAGEPCMAETLTNWEMEEREKSASQTRSFRSAADLADDLGSIERTSVVGALQAQRDRLRGAKKAAE
jgi:hypothetical protein